MIALEGMKMNHVRQAAVAGQFLGLSALAGNATSFLAPLSLDRLLQELQQGRRGTLGVGAKLSQLRVVDLPFGEREQTGNRRSRI